MTTKTNLLIGGLLLSLLNLNSAQAENEYFKRKPGLWEIKVNSSGREIPAVKQCIDEATDIKMQEMGNEIGKNCAKRENKKSGNQYLVSSECSFQGTSIKSEGVFKGDFTTGYEGDIKATYNPPILGRSEGNTKVVAKWLGECGAGNKPGDIIMANGSRINISQMKDLAGMMKK